MRSWRDYEETSLKVLEDYYIIEYKSPAKGPSKKEGVGWNHRRMSLADIEFNWQNIGLLVGAIYTGGHGWLEIDIDDYYGLEPVLPALEEAGVLEHTLHGIMKSGGEHNGWKVFCWLHAAAWDLPSPYKAKLNGVTVELRGSKSGVMQAVVPPSKVINFYEWMTPIPSKEVCENWASLITDAQLAEHVDAWKRLYSELEFIKDEGSGGDYVRDGDLSSLPSFVEGDFHRLLEALAHRGVGFGRNNSDNYHDSLIIGRDQAGGRRVLGVQLFECFDPNCKSRRFDRHSQSSEVAKTWMTPSLRLKCFHKHSCEIGRRREEGMLLREWLPKYFPDLEDKFLVSSPDGDPGDGVDIDEGKSQTEELIREVVKEADEDSSLVVLLDSPPGMGKTRVWIELGTQSATEGACPALFAPRHVVIDESIGRSLKLFERDVAFTEDPPRYLPLAGKDRTCKYHKSNNELSRYSTAPIGRLCRSCTEDRRCDYHWQWGWAKTAGSFNLAPHQLLTKVVSETPHTGSVWVDELPDFEDRLELLHGDVAAYSAEPPDPDDQGDGFTREERLYLEARKEAAAALISLLEVVATRGGPTWREYLFGEELKGLLDDGLLRQTLSYDPNIGRHPGLAPDREAPGVRRYTVHFDEVRKPLLNLLDGSENMDEGVISVFRDPDGKAGFEVLRRGKVLAEDRGAVITAAGSRHLGTYLKAMLPERNVSVRTVDVKESKLVERLGVDVRTLSAKELAKPEKRTRTVRHLLLRLLPRVIMWAAKHEKEQVRLGVACPKVIHEDFESGVEEISEAVEVLEGCGVTLQWGSRPKDKKYQVEHYGNLHGSNQFREVDVWLRLGGNIPNLGYLKLLTHGLNAEGRDITETLLREAKVAYNEVQDRGRARPKERTKETPLLDVKCGYFPDGYPVMLAVKGQPPGLSYFLYELVTRAFLIYLGWCSSPEMKSFLLKEEDAAKKGLSAYSPEVFPAVVHRAVRHLLSSLKNKGTTPGEFAFDRRSAGERLKEVAEEMGARQSKRKTAAEDAEQVVYIVPGEEIDSDQLAEGDALGPSSGT